MIRQNMQNMIIIGGSCIQSKEFMLQYQVECRIRLSNHRPICLLTANGEPTLVVELSEYANAATANAIRDQAREQLKNLRLDGSVRRIVLTKTPLMSGQEFKVSRARVRRGLETGAIVPPGKGVACLEDTLRAASKDRAGEILLTIEPHLMDFTGLSSLSKLDDIRHVYSFETPYDAFEYAFECVKEMVERIG